MNAEKAKKSPRKIISNTISWVLGGLILLLVVFQIIMVRSSSYVNYGVPSLFGYSFMSVATDSMVGTASDSLPVGTGVIMRQIPVGDVSTSDVITFKSDYLTSKAGFTVVVSHRVQEILLSPSKENGYGGVAAKVGEEYSLDGGNTWVTSDGKLVSALGGTAVRIRLISSPDDSMVSYNIPTYNSESVGAYTFYACGDNLNAETCGTNGCARTYRDKVTQSNYIGKIVSHNDALGWLLGVAMSTWFVPVCCLVPLAIIVTFSAIDLVKEGRGEQAEEERQILLAANKAGVDPNDERAYLLFSEKQRYKLQVREQLEKAKEEERKRILREMKKKGNGAATMEVKS
jgi:hypothetical protein